jgi:probable HAF family extracellular repeat protein
MTKQTAKNFALSLLGLLLIPSTSLAQAGPASILPGKKPITDRAQMASHQAKTPGTPSYTYTLLSFPGSLETDAYALNPGATASKIEIVGSYGTGAFVAHVSEKKTVVETYKAVSYPHDGSATDINDLGQVVGQYVDGGGVTHGFELNDKKFTTLDVPFAGSKGTYPTAINNSGEIVGSWSDGGISQGFTLIDGTYTSLDYPGATYTFVDDVNSQGDIVGIYISPDSNGNQGYLLSGGTYTSIEFPGAVQTQAIAINDAGVIVGVYFTSDPNLTQGFVLSGGVYTTLTVPGEPYTFLDDINDNGVVLGAYEDAGGLTVSFLATPIAGQQE